MDMAKDMSTYIFRIGRTGRIDFGKSLTFITEYEETLAHDIADSFLKKDEKVPPTLDEIIKTPSLFGKFFPIMTF